MLSPECSSSLASRISLGRGSGSDLTSPSYPDYRLVRADARRFGPQYFDETLPNSDGRRAAGYLAVLSLTRWHAVACPFRSLRSGMWELQAGRRLAQRG